MRSWESGFSFQLRFRGKNYYEEGRVTDLVKDGDRYSATVHGGEDYHVSLVYDGRHVSVFRCDCEYSKGGYRCKHMAAVLYAIDGGKAKSEPKKVKEPPHILTPFAKTEETGEANPGVYRYFDFHAIAGDLTVEEKNFERAQKLVREEHEPLQVTIHYQGEDSWYYSSKTYGEAAVAIGTQREDYPEILFTCKERSRLTCTCWRGKRASYGEEPICEHQAALLLMLKDYLETTPCGDETNAAGDGFLRAFEDALTGSENPAQKKARIRLVPYVSQNAEETLIHFRTGRDKLLNVRNIADFVDTVRKEGTYTLGKNLILDFAAETFDAESQALFDWMVCLSSDEQSRRAYTERKNHQTLTAGKTESSYLLEGSRTDELWELLQGQTLEFQTKDEEGSKKTRLLRLEDGGPDFKARLEPLRGEKKQLLGVKLSGELPRFIKGAHTDLVAGGDTICRMPAEAVTVLRPLYRTAQNGLFELKIGRNHLSKFYYRVLPKLRQYMTVMETEPERIEALLPLPLKLTFYLDMEEELARCRTEASYGERNYTLGAEPESLAEKQQRDILAESLAQQTVQRYFPLYDPERDEFRQAETDEEALFTLLTEGVEALRALGEVQATDRFQALSVRRRVHAAAGVALESGVLELTITTEDVSREELREVLKSYRLKKRYHRLKDGTLLEMDGEVEQLGRMMDELQLSPQQFTAQTVRLPAYRALALSNRLDEGGLQVQRDKRLRRCLKDFGTVRDADWDVPESLRRVVRDYQQYGYKWLRTLESYHFGGILADDMGLGKTLQTILVLLAAKEEGHKGPSLVVTPASLVYNWKEEIWRFAPSLIVGLVAGTARERGAMLARREDYDVLVTSYELLRRDAERYEGCHFLFEVIDEAQFIKNHSTGAARSVRAIDAEYRFALTGTPIENRLSELWSIFDYLMPGFLYSYEAFRREFELPIVKLDDAEARARLARMVGPFILRRLKKDVLKDLPDKLEEVRVAQMTDEQRLAYDAQAARILDLVQGTGEEEFAQKRFGILAELTHLRQLCCDPSLILENYKGGSAKRELVLDLLQSALEGEHRVLLFSQFTSMLDLLEQDLKTAGISFLRLDGSTPKPVRQELMDRFNGGEGAVFLVSLKAGGTGLNLTGADVVIHYDPWWNEAVQNQATDRAHRIGQTRVVTVYRLLCKDTVEEKILALQEKKRDLADSILSAGSADVSQLTRDELLQLLR